MNQDEILKIIGHVNHPVAMGGYNSDTFDDDCHIYNLVVFDAKDIPDEIIIRDSNLFKISHGNLSEHNSEVLLSYSNLEIILDEQWDLKQLLSKIQITKILKGGKIVSEIKENQIKLSNELKSDKKSIVKNEKETKKTVKKKTVIKTKNKK